VIRRLGVAAGLVAVVAGLLAPGFAHGQDPAGEPLEPMSACELFQPEEVAEAIGTVIVGSEDLAGSIVEDADGWISFCHYLSGPEVILPAVAVTLAAGPGYREAFDDLRLALDAIPVADLGDDAVLQLPVVWGLDQPAASLHVRAGDAILGLSLGAVDVAGDGSLIQLGDADAQAAALTALAAIGLERIGGSVAPPIELPPICDLLGLEAASELIGATLVASEVIGENDDWGPGCHYRDAADDVLLFVGMTTGPEALARFATCQASGQPEPGVGEAAFVGNGSGCEVVPTSSYFIVGPLVVRSADTVLVVAAVTEAQGPVNKTGSREAQAVIARQLLEQLGFDPGATPAPIDPALLDHPCGLLSPDEVGEVVGVTITSVQENPPREGYPTATCTFVALDGNAFPLTLYVTTGEEALEQWASYLTYRAGDKVPVEGLGDEALSEEVEGFGDFDGPRGLDVGAPGRDRDPAGHGLGRSASRLHHEDGRHARGAAGDGADARRARRPAARWVVSSP
jgi:hypothetical protein